MSHFSENVFVFFFTIKRKEMGMQKEKVS